MTSLRYIQAMESQRDTFVVRIERNEVDRVVGMVEHVRTGAKARFEGLDAISAVIAGMLPSRACDSPEEARSPRS